jgi:hypothetical protein
MCFFKGFFWAVVVHSCGRQRIPGTTLFIRRYRAIPLQPALEYRQIVVRFRVRASKGSRRGNGGCASRAGGRRVMSSEFDSKVFDRMLRELEFDRERLVPAVRPCEPKRTLRSVLLGAAGELARASLHRCCAHLPEALLVGGLLLAAVLAPKPSRGTPGPVSIEWNIRQSDAWTANYLRRAAEVDAKKKDERNRDDPTSSWGPDVGSKRP